MNEQRVALREQIEALNKEEHVTGGSWFQITGPIMANARV